VCVVVFPSPRVGREKIGYEKKKKMN